MIKSSYLFILFLFLMKNAHSQRLEFYREDLTFYLGKDYFSVKGDYYFKNKTQKDVKTILMYPFPNNVSSGYVDSVYATLKMKAENCVKSVSGNKFMMFDVFVRANDTAIYEIGYRQKHSSGYATYILTTTQRWGKPFDTVNYTLVVKDLVVDSISYVPDAVKFTEENTTYFWHKRAFMPDRDFEVWFH